MASFFETVSNIGKIEDLKKKIFFTLLMLLVVRIGSHITLPGVDVDLLSARASQGGGDLLGFYDLFVGGAFSNAAIFALGIMPYITASIIFQLAGIVIPEIQKMQREGEEGRRRITQYTRYATVIISALQAIAITVRLTSSDGSTPSVVPDPSLLFYVSAVSLMTAGTVFMMWLGEQITEKGIGNGISLIIFINIIAVLPIALAAEAVAISNEPSRLIFELIICSALF